jgi:septation ring formation regulator EzrA
VLAAVTRNKHRTEQLIYHRLSTLERQSQDHETRLAVVQSCQINTAERLSDIKDTTEQTNDKIDQVSRTLTDVLVAIKMTR